MRCPDSKRNGGSKEQLESYKRGYCGSIAAYIAEHPEKRFVITSPPPRKRLLSSPRSREFAHEFSTFLCAFSKERNNCHYFDLFELLCEDNTLAEQYCRFLPWDQHPNLKGAQLAAETFMNILQRS